MRPTVFTPACHRIPAAQGFEEPRWCTALWALLLGLLLSLTLATGPQVCAAEELGITPAARRLETLDVVFNEAILGLPSYVYVDEHERLAGSLIDMWDCVFERAGIQAQYRLLPNVRAMHELLSGRADFHGAKVNIGRELQAFDGAAHYTEVVAQIYEVLLVRLADRSLLADGLWWQQRVGVVRATVINQKVEALGGSTTIRTENFQQALKQLVSGRVDVVLYLSNLPGRAFKHFQGHDLMGRTLSRVNGHGLLSAARHRTSPDLLGRINREIPVCNLILSLSG